MRVEKQGNIFIAVFKGSDGGTFQGAGKTKEELLKHYNNIVKNIEEQI